MAFASLPDQQRLADQRRQFFLQALGASTLLHLMILGGFAFAPSPPPVLIPAAITVDLVAALPASPASPAKALAPPAPSKPKVKILPKEAPTPPPVAKTKPKPKSKPRPQSPPEPVVARRERPEELSYEDALAKLRNDVGEAPPLAATEVQASVPLASSVQQGAARTGLVVAPELAAWNLAVMRHVRSVWITPPEFRNRGLAAQLDIDLAADGRVVGKPQLVRSSGNPYFDDNAVRAVLRASPLPAPPKAGSRSLVFTSEE